MKITGIQLAKRVEKWGKTLSTLGVAHFVIDRVVLCDETPAGRGYCAEVVTMASYDSASFYFTHNFLEDVEARELDQTIIHEWVHVAMRDLDQAITSIDPQLSPAAQHLWCDRVHHEREGLVERLALTLYDMHTGLKPRFSP